MCLTLNRPAHYGFSPEKTNAADDTESRYGHYTNEQVKKSTGQFHSRNQIDSFYHEDIERHALELSNHGQPRSAITLIQSAIQSFIPRNLHEWTRYLSLQHTLGTILVTCKLYAEASKVFASIVLICVGYSNENLPGVGTQQDLSNTGIPSLISAIKMSYQSFKTFIAPNLVSSCRLALFAEYDGQLPFAYDLCMENHRNTADARISITSNVIEELCRPLSIVCSNSLLNLAKLFQDGANSGSPSKIVYLNGSIPSFSDIFSLYVLSYTLNKSPSTANNMGILLVSLLGETPTAISNDDQLTETTADLRTAALEYYEEGLSLDPEHPHLHTNFGSLLRQDGRIEEALKSYENAIRLDPHFAIALTNLASCLKDLGRIEQAVEYYKRAVDENEFFAEAVSGLVTCYGASCHWIGRGSYGWETFAVNLTGDLIRGPANGWVVKTIHMADRQIAEARRWGVGAINFIANMQNGQLFREIPYLPPFLCAGNSHMKVPWHKWSNSLDEGEHLMTLIEHTTKQLQWQWYMDKMLGRQTCRDNYLRPVIPAILTTPPLATTILPFHAFTLPFSNDQIRNISEKCATRISVAALIRPAVPKHVYAPPAPPKNGVLKVGYISSDFANHPLSHLMQSVFGLHDRNNVLPYAYATSVSDNSHYRKKIEAESHVFRDVTSWTAEDIAEQITNDGIHALVNLNGFTKGSRNSVFALRPCPVQISLMGFAGPMGANWIDYILGDRIATPLPSPSIEVPYKKEKIIYMPNSLFCCDHRQSAPDARRGQSNNWEQELQFRKRLRRELFPNLNPDWFLMANFNQLYKIEPNIFAVWLRILSRLPHSYLWLLQFPKSGQENLLNFAGKWTGGRDDIKERIIFTPVAEKDIHIIRARACDLVLDTPECNAHTTAADIMWSCTPMLTYPRYTYKLCSRIAASILHSAFPDTPEGQEMVSQLVVNSNEEYEQRAVEYGATSHGRNLLLKMRKCLFYHRFDSRLFDTRRYVADLEIGYLQAWNDWISNRRENIFISNIYK